MLLQPVAISEKQIDPINNCFDRVFIYFFVVQQQVAKYHAAQKNAPILTTYIYFLFKKGEFIG